jgi:2-(1,2-epoxy-1,2-dihydrophenyl)acetyl-CoA isomerase
MAFGAGKKLFKNAVTPSLEAYLDSEASAQINLMLSDDHREGARAFFEKRKPAFKGT